MAAILKSEFDVFISYMRDDDKSGFVTELAQQLQSSGKTVWIDSENIPLGENFIQTFEEGLDKSDIVISILSSHYMASKNCRIELARAVENKKRIIPIVIEENFDFSEFNTIAGNRNAITISKLEPLQFHLSTILHALNEDPQYTAEHTRLLLRARNWEEHKGNLLSGSELLQAETWLDSNREKPQNPPSELHTKFIRASRQAATQRLRRLAIISVVVSVVLLGLAIFAVIQARLADRRAQESQSLALAANAQLVQPNDAFLGLSLAVEANTIDRPPPLAQQVLSEIAYAPTALLQRFSGVHKNYVEALSFDPSGKFVATGAFDGSLALWHVDTGKVYHQLVGHQYEVHELAFSPDGHWLLSAAGDLDVGGELFLWDVETGELLRQLKGHVGSVDHVLFSPDGQSVLSSGYDNTIIRWDVNTWEETHRYNAFIAGVGAMVYGPDGRTFFTASSFSAPAELIQWDVNTGRRLKRYDLAYNSIGDLAITSDGKLIAYSGYLDKPEIILMNVKDGKEVRRFVGHTQEINALDFSPDNQLLLSGSSDNTARLWNVTTGDLLYTFNMPEQNIYDVAFSPDGKSILFGKSDGSTELWNTDPNRPGALERRFLFPDLIVFDVAFSPDEKSILASIGFDLVLLDAETGQELRRFIDDDPRDIVRQVLFLPDGQRALSASENGLLILWDMSTGKAIRRFEQHKGRIASLDLSSDGQTVLSGGADGKVIWWDLNSGNVIKQFESDGFPISSIAFSPDEHRIAVAACTQMTALKVCQQGEILIWDALSGSVLQKQSAHNGQINIVAFSPDGLFLVSGGEDNSIILWDANTLKQVNQLNGHDDIVSSAVFSADSSTILSASYDRSLILWDVKSGQPIRRLRGLDIRNNRVVLSADGHRALSGGGSSTFGGQIAIWRLDISLEELIHWTYQNRFVRELTCDERQKYQVSVSCDAVGIYPTRTPYPVNS